MHLTIRRLRGLLLGLGILTLSATVVLAGQPSGSAASWTGLAKAAEKSGRTVPTVGDEDTDTDEATDTDAETETDGNTCDVDLMQDPTALSAYTHGEIVCSAAHMATPDGFANHGAWVRSWAKWGTGGADAGRAGSEHKAKGLGHKP